MADDHMLSTTTSQLTAESNNNCTSAPQMSAALPISTTNTSPLSSTEASPSSVRVESILDVQVPCDTAPTPSSNLTDPHRDVQPYDANVMTSFCASRHGVQTNELSIAGGRSGLVDETINTSNVESNHSPSSVVVTNQQMNTNPVRHHNYPAPRNGRNQTRLRPSTKLCQCFSPTQSDSDDENTTQQFVISGETSSAVPSHLPAVTPAVAAGGRSSANHFPGHASIVSLAREIRCRFALAAEAHNQSTNAAQFRRNMRSGIEMSAAPYPVHSTTEYTHYLVPDLDRITNAPYYWGVMDRFEAEKLLESKPEGTFLLRDSAQTEYVFSVSFRRYNRTLHARIEQAEHRFSFDCFDPQVFSALTVTELVEHYKEPSRCLFFEPQLTTPLSRSFVMPLQHLCRAVICSNMTDYNQIDQLPLPAGLMFRDYLKEYHYKHKVRTISNMNPSTSAAAASTSSAAAVLPSAM